MHNVYSKYQLVLIPKIAILSSIIHFIFKIKKFLVEVCSAITINFYKGNNFESMESIPIREDCFSHEQFYGEC